MESNPAAFYVDSVDGIVQFYQCSPDDETLDYSVTLHEFINIDLTVDQTRQVILNSGEITSYSKADKIPLHGLRYGDTVTIETDKAWPALENLEELVCLSVESNPKSQYYDYTLSVSEGGKTFEFDPADYTYEHGSFTFTYMGQTVTGPISCTVGRKIGFEAHPDAHYYYSGENDYIKVSSDDSITTAALTSLGDSFAEEKMVQVTLPRPAYGGTVEYSVDGEILEGTSCYVYTGTEISIKYNPWEGWQTQYVGTKTYEARDASAQSAVPDISKISNFDINAVFTEAAEHTPALTVYLKDDIGNLMVTISQGDMPLADKQHYSDGDWVSIGTRRVIDDAEIGTDKPINFDISGGAIPSGKAVKIEVVKKGTNAETRKSFSKTEFYYFDDLSETIAPYYIYEPGAEADAPEWYSEIEMTIDVVDIVEFEEPELQPHTTLTVIEKSTGKILQNGDLVEPATDVKITISPDALYGLSGYNVGSDGDYSKSMKMSSYVKDISEIVDAYPAVKGFFITLQTADIYGEYKYTWMFEKVSGKIFVYPGKYLSLKYTLTDDNYIFPDSPKKRSYSADIMITEEDAGRVFDREDFGINVVYTGGEDR